MHNSYKWIPGGVPIPCIFTKFIPHISSEICAKRSPKKFYRHPQCRAEQRGLSLEFVFTWTLSLFADSLLLRWWREIEGWLRSRWKWWLRSRWKWWWRSRCKWWWKWRWQMLANRSNYCRLLQKLVLVSASTTWEYNNNLKEFTKLLLPRNISSWCNTQILEITKTTRKISQIFCFQEIFQANVVHTQ